MKNYTKSERREIQKYVGMAYEIELSRQLERIRVEFDRWKAGKINCFDLNQSIHEYHNGIQQELWKVYEMNSLPVIALLGAIERGVIKQKDLSEEFKKTLNLEAYLENAENVDEDN